MVAHNHIDRSQSRRRGECKRCGTCCKLLFRCPFLDESTDPCTCKLYGRHLRWCENFPIDESDIADRDRISADMQCGYYFSANGNGRHVKSECPATPSEKGERKNI